MTELEEAIVELKNRVIAKAHQLGFDVKMVDLVTVQDGNTIWVYPAEGTPGGPVCDEA